LVNPIELQTLGDHNWAKVGIKKCSALDFGKGIVENRVDSCLKDYFRRHGA